MKKVSELYSGKAKSLHTTEDPDLMVMEFRDDTSAFNGQKLAQLERKGLVNNQFNAFIMQTLEDKGIKTHFERVLSPNESLVKSLTMMPIECVVRNVAAGGICKRLGIEEGTNLRPATFEFFLKDDELGDPMINEYHINSFGWADAEHVAEMKRITFAVNDVLIELFADGGMILVDYKLEFGLYKGEVLLADEFSPDGCRLWDAETRTKMDKDRFRQGLGNVIETYEEVGKRLGMEFTD
ncbi:MAG: phosphoribosylaminoimidazolesuccinocarboxamide synthase [Pseudomonadota bacterium]